MTTPSAGPATVAGPADAQRARDERTIGRLLGTTTMLAVTILVVGVVLMAIAGISPLDPAPAFDPASVARDILAFAPEGFLWLGLLVVIATPILRVIAAGLVYARGREWRMLAISIAILIVIATAIVTALATEV